MRTHTIECKAFVIVENEIEKQKHIAEERKSRVHDLKNLYIEAAGEDGILTRSPFAKGVRRPGLLPSDVANSICNIAHVVCNVTNVICDLANNAFAEIVVHSAWKEMHR